MGEYTDDKFMIAFIKENQEKFYRVAYSYAKNPEEALDLVQDAIVNALQKRYTLKHPEYLKTWFYRILINECLMFLRKNKKLVYLENLENYSDEPSISSLENNNIDLYNAIEHLSPQYKTIILLRYFEEMKLEEIAKITGANINTVKSRLYKALKILKIDMEDEIYDR